MARWIDFMSGLLFEAAGWRIRFRKYVVLYGRDRLASLLRTTFPNITACSISLAAE
jgi:hypothetical protein